MTPSKAAEAFLDLLFPPRCAICARVGVRGICPACEKALPYADRPLHEGAPFGRCVAPLRYDGVVREALLRYKFRGGRSACIGFGQLVARAAAEQFSGEFDLVTYVPVSAQRLRERGYDQSRLLAREAAKCWDTRPLTLLRKIADTPPNSSLRSPEERRGNVLGAYEAADADRIRGARILLVDDILTTGATLGECVRVLTDAGAAGVVCAVAAAAEKD